MRLLTGSNSRPPMAKIATASGRSLQELRKYSSQLYSITPPPTPRPRASAKRHQHENVITGDPSRGGAKRRVDLDVVPARNPWLTPPGGASPPKCFTGVSSIGPSASKQRYTPMYLKGIPPVTPSVLLCGLTGCFVWVIHFTRVWVPSRWKEAGKTPACSSARRQGRIRPSLEPVNTLRRTPIATNQNAGQRLSASRLTQN